MADQPTDYDEDLAAIWAVVGESFVSMSDDDVLAEVAAQGEDPRVIAQHVQKLFSDADKAHSQRLLRVAREEYKQRTREIDAYKCRLPDSPEQRRNLLNLVIANEPNLLSAIPTLHHQKFQELTDADVETLLTELDELGALVDLLPSDKQG